MSTPMSMKVTAVVQTEVDTNALADWLKRLLSGEPATASVAPPITFSFDIETYYDGQPVAKMTVPVEVKPSIATTAPPEFDAAKIEQDLWEELHKQCLDLGKTEADWQAARKVYHTVAMMGAKLAALDASQRITKPAPTSPMESMQKLSSQQRANLQFRAKAQGMSTTELNDLIVSLDGDHARILEEMEVRKKDNSKKLLANHNGQKGGK